VATQIAYVEKHDNKIQWSLGIPCEFYGLWGFFWNCVIFEELE
jgi:hypothetical protein